jgi:hypothetical protein
MEQISNVSDALPGGVAESRQLFIHQHRDPLLDRTSFKSYSPDGLASTNTRL